MTHVKREPTRSDEADDGQTVAAARGVRVLTRAEQALAAPAQLTLYGCALVPASRLLLWFCERCDIAIELRGGV